MNKKVPIYGDGRASVYALSEIYDPGRPISSMQNIAAPTPRVNSLVIDDTIGEHNTLYVVYSVDPETRKCTLVPAKLMNDVDLYDNQIVTYGNNIYMLYWKTTTMDVYDRTADKNARPSKVYYARSGDAETGYTYRKISVATGTNLEGATYYERVSKTLWQLTIDQKISVFGTKITKFALFRGANLTEAGDRSLVSDYYLNDLGQAVQTTKIGFDLVTVQATDGSEEEYTTNLKVPKVCYSSSQVENNDVFCLVMYDDEDRVVAQITLLAHDMLGLSELASKQWPIESFTVSANQYDSVDGKCFLFRGQRLDELVFYPQIRYADGNSISDAQIDSTKLLIYGKDEISTATPGSEYKVLLKYYLSSTEGVADNNTRDYQIGETGRFIYTYVTVKIIAPSESSVSKIVPIPIFNQATGWDILPVVYYRNRQRPRAIANTSWLASAFVGDNYQTTQPLKIQTVEQDPDSAIPTEFTSSYTITLYNPTTLTEEPKVCYTFKDEPAVTNRSPYGSNSASIPRPRIVRELDTTTSEVRTYIQQSVFQTVEVFLNAFYYQAEPPTIASEGGIRRPTHFQIRQALVGTNNIDVVTVNPIPVEAYANPIALTEDLSNSEAIPGTCIVEFLYHGSGMAADAYDYLYGVPVDMVKSIINSDVGDWHGILYCTYNGFNYRLSPTGSEDNINYHRTWGDSTLKLKAKLSGTTSYSWALYNASNQLITDGVSDSVSIATGKALAPDEVGWTGSNVTYMSRYPWDNTGDCRRQIYIRVRKHNYVCPYNPQASDAINVRRKWTILSDNDVTIGSIEITQIPGTGFKWCITISSGASAGTYVSDYPLTGSSTECPAEVTWNSDSNVTWVSHDEPPVIEVESPVYVEGTKDVILSPNVPVVARVIGSNEAPSFVGSGFPSGLAINRTTGKIYGTPRGDASVGERDGTVTVSSANTNPVTATVHFTIHDSAAFRGTLYAIVDGEKYTFQYKNGNGGDEINQHRWWEDRIHQIRIAAMGDFESEGGNWGWWFFKPDENGVYHYADEGADWESQRVFVGVCNVLSNTQLNLDPDTDGVTLGSFETHMTYFSRVEPGYISGPTTYTISLTTGSQMDPVTLPHVAYGAGTGNPIPCTFTVDPNNQFPGTIEINNSTGIITGQINAANTYTSVVNITADGCPDAKCTITFVVEDPINCHRQNLYVITKSANVMKYQVFRYASSSVESPARRKWTADSGMTIRQVSNDDGYWWVFVGSASDSDTTIVYQSETRMEANSLLEPFDAVWNLTEVVYISKNPTDIIQASDLTIDFWKNVPITTQRIPVQSKIGMAPPITFSFATPYGSISGITVDSGGNVSGSINADMDQNLSVEISCNVTGIPSKFINLLFDYKGGDVYQGPYWLYYSWWQGKLIYTGTASDVGYQRSWRNVDGDVPSIVGSPSTNQWFVQLLDGNDESYPCIPQEDQVPIDPDDPRASLGIDAVSPTYILSRTPVSIGIVSKKLNETTSHYDPTTKTLTLEIGETVQLVASSSDTSEMSNQFTWPTINTGTTTDPRYPYLTVTSDGYITARAAYSGSGDLEIEVHHATHTFMKETIKVVITIPAPGPGLTANDVTVNFTPGETINGQATANTQYPAQLTWTPNNFPSGITMDSSTGAITGTCDLTETFTRTATVSATLNGITETVTITVTFNYVADNTFRGTLYTIAGGIERTLIYAGSTGTERGFARSWIEDQNSSSGSDALVGIQRYDNDPYSWMVYWGSGGPQGWTATLPDGADPYDQTYTNGYRVTTYRLQDLISGPGIPNSTIEFHEGYDIGGVHGTVPAANRTATATSTATDRLPNGFTWSGNLPQGFSIDSTTGVITGTYTGSSSATTFTGTITATSTTYSQVSKTWTITFTKASTWTTQIICDNPYTINFDTGVQISSAIQASDSGSGNTLTFNVLSGQPSEITMNESGFVSGTFNTTETRTMQIRIYSSTATGQPYKDVTVQFVYSASGSNWVGNLYVAGTGFYETMTVPATHATTVGFERVWTGPNTRIDYHASGNQWICTYNGTEIAWGSYADRNHDPDNASWVSDRFAISKTPLENYIVRATSSDHAGVSTETVFTYTPDVSGSVLIGFKSSDTAILAHGMSYEIRTSPASGSDTFSIENLTSSSDQATNPMILRLNYKLADAATDKTLVLRVKSHAFPNVYKDFTISFRSGLLAPTSITATTPVTVNYAPSSTISQQLSATANQPSTIRYIAADYISGITLNEETGLITGRITTTTDQTMRVNVTATNRVGSFVSPAAITVTFHYVSDGVFRGSLYVFLNGTEYTLSYQGNEQTLGTDRSWLNMTGRLSLGYSNGNWILRQEDSTLATATPVNTTDDPDTLTWSNNFHVFRTAQSSQLTLLDKLINYNDGFTLEQSNTSDASRQVVVVHSSSSLVPNTWRYTSSNLPSGVTLNSTTGIITGQVSSSTDIVFSVLATNTSDGNITKTCSVTLHMNTDGGTVISITLPQTINYRSGDAVSASVQATDSAGAPLTLSASGTPSGVTFSSTGGSGSLSGTLSGTGDYIVTITATRGWPGGQQTAVTTVTFHYIPTPTVNYSDIQFQPEGISKVYTLSYVPGSDTDGDGRGRHWWYASDADAEYYEIYANVVGVEEGDQVWILEHGGWANDSKQGGGIDATSSPCFSPVGPPDATWADTVFESIQWVTT